MYYVDLTKAIKKHNETRVIRENKYSKMRKSQLSRDLMDSINRSI